jgi:hypothetical protein
MKFALIVSTRRCSRWVALSAALALFGPAVCVLAQDGNPNPGIAPPNSMPYGLSYGEWGAEWWKWVLGIPAAENPVLDPTGEFADVDQAGPVWFLAGTLGDPTPLERTITVPVGKAVFFPLVSFVYWGPDDLPVAIEVAELLGVDPAHLSDEELLRLLANFSLVELSELRLTIDGVEIENLESYFADSPGFSIEDDDLLDDFGFPPDGHELFVTAGYWIMLAPLPPGEHTLDFKATIDDSPLGPSSVDVTTHITIMPR